MFTDRCREDCPWKGYTYDNMIRHICTDCRFNRLTSSVIRYLLDSARVGKLRSYKELEEYIADVPANPMTLSNVLEHFEFRGYIQSDSEGLWSITQKGIDHFFRVEEGE